MRARVAWWIYAAVGGVLAVVVVASWLGAVALRAPVLYGEGAVAHAAILARDNLEYTSGAQYGGVSPIFTAANYPPLYFQLAGLGDPFLVGRLVSIGATLFIAAAIAFRARASGALVAVGIGLAWLGSIPVMAWGLAIKPDPLALALTVAATLALARARPLPLVAGVLIGLAVMAKPTALVTGLALLVYVARRDTRGAIGMTTGGVVAVLATALLTQTPSGMMWIHVVDWNALPWRPELAAPLVLIALLVLAVPILTAVVTRTGSGPVGAYLVGAIGVLLLGGREGATVNYFLDLSAALALTAATVAPRLQLSIRYPMASMVQLAIGVILLNPFPTTPSLLSPTGKWSEPSWVAYVRDYVPGTVLIEDSGLLIANGREPIVDDLFLWSRNYAIGKSFREGQLLLDAVRAGRFDAVVTEVELERIDTGPGYERQRWHGDLVAAVLERYQQPFRRTYGLCAAFMPCRQLFVYVPR